VRKRLDEAHDREHLPRDVPSDLNPLIAHYRDLPCPFVASIVECLTAGRCESLDREKVRDSLGTLLHTLSKRILRCA
jgi:hypothetical protein